MAKNKCANCGYKFKPSDDGAICPECLSARNISLNSESLSSDIINHRHYENNLTNDNFEDKPLTHTQPSNDNNTGNIQKPDISGLISSFKNEGKCDPNQVSEKIGGFINSLQPYINQNKSNPKNKINIVFIIIAFFVFINILPVVIGIIVAIIKILFA